MKSCSDSSCKTGPVVIPFKAFGAVAGLTVLNVLVHYSGIPSSWRIALHLLLALGQATLIGVFSMHLISERRMVLWVGGFTVFFCIVLFALSLLGKMDGIHL